MKIIIITSFVKHLNTQGITEITLYTVSETMETLSQINGKTIINIQ